jgi:osmotically inducible lipoprotein OsmB
MRAPRIRSIRNIILTIAIAGAVTLSACSGQPLTTREKGTLGGGAIGAGRGAPVGLAVGHPLAGAAIGGVVGAGTGMPIRNSLQDSESRHHHSSQETE